MDAPPLIAVSALYLKLISTQHLTIIEESVVFWFDWVMPNLEIANTFYNIDSKSKYVCQVEKLDIFYITNASIHIWASNGEMGLSLHGVVYKTSFCVIYMSSNCITVLYNFGTAMNSPTYSLVRKKYNIIHN